MTGIPGWAQILLGVVPIVVALVAYRQAVRAAAVTAQAAERTARRQAEIERSKVDAEAYARARQIYETALQQLERQVAWIQARCDELAEQLSRERDTSMALRRQVRELNDQVRAMDRTVADAHEQLHVEGFEPLNEGA